MHDQRGKIEAVAAWRQGCTDHAAWCEGKSFKIFNYNYLMDCSRVAEGAKFLTSDDMHISQRRVYKGLRHFGAQITPQGLIPLNRSS